MGSPGMVHPDIYKYNSRAASILSAAPTRAGSSYRLDIKHLLSFSIKLLDAYA
jgi:hypothetical protein